jgi:micrococcal nuclease
MIKRPQRLTLLLLCLTLLLIPTSSPAWQGKLVGVTDGDTIQVLHNGKAEKVRLYGIDCPEKRQDFGTRARQFISEMVFGKTVEVESIDTDRDGRTVRHSGRPQTAQRLTLGR